MKIGRFRKWLIRKLGGQVYMTDHTVFHTENLQPVTLKYMQAFRRDVQLSTNEVVDLVSNDAAKNIGKQIIDGGLCTTNISFDPEFNVNKIVFTVRILKPGEGE